MRGGSGSLKPSRRDIRVAMPRRYVCFFGKTWQEHFCSSKLIPSGSCSCLAASHLLHLLVMRLLAACLGLLNLVVLRLEALGSLLALKHLFNQGPLPVLVGQSGTEEFCRSFDDGANLRKLGDLWF